MNAKSDMVSTELDQFIKSLGIDSLPKEKRDELLVKITEVLLKRIFIETMDKLGESGRDEYEALVQKNPQPEELENFFSERIDNYDEIIKNIVEQFKKEMIGVE